MDGDINFGKVEKIVICRLFPPKKNLKNKNKHSKTNFSTRRRKKPEANINHCKKGSKTYLV